MKFYFFPLLLLLTLLSSCNGVDHFVNGVSGGANEVLFVVSKADYQTPAGKAAFDVLNTDVDHLPQSEPMFNISRVIPSVFKNSQLNSTRNIVFLTLDSTRYTTPKIRLVRNQYANTQTSVIITAPNSKSVAEKIEERGPRIIEFFREAELQRLTNYYLKQYSQKSYDAAYKKFGIQLCLPQGLDKMKTDANFLWISNGSQGARKDIVIYSYPYTSQDQLTVEALNKKRDTILGQQITGRFEGSKMGTEYRYFPPTGKVINLHGEYCMEIHGLWRMLDGEAMGGPYVSHTQIDEIHNRVITIEGYVFAPSRQKRNLVRQIEAMLNTTRMPQEINQINIIQQKTKTKN